MEQQQQAGWRRWAMALCLMIGSLLSAPLAAANSPRTPPGKEKALQQSISLTFSDAPIALILQALADHQQLNLVTGKGVEGRLTLRLQAVPWQQALEVVLRMGQLTSQKQGKVLMVFPESELLQQRQQKMAQAEQDRLARPLISRTLVLRHAQASEVASFLNTQKGSLLSPRAVVSADPAGNTLLIRDARQELDHVRAWLENVDRPVRQVQLAAHIVTINRDSLRELGVRWGFNRATTTQEKNGLAGSVEIGAAVEKPMITAGFNLVRIGGRMLDVELTALEQQDRVEIIASPRLLTANLQTASIKQGTEIPYQVSSGASGSTSIEFKEAVLGMEVTPQILPDGAITLQLQISQNMPGRKIKQAEGEALSIDKQEIKTQVTVKDGETLVLGGIFQQHGIKSENKVPILGNLPLFGSLFTQQSNQGQRRELVIFITPTLISS